MSFDEKSQNFFNELKKNTAELGLDLELPHQSMKTLDTVFTEIEHGKMMTAMFKFNRSFCNPFRRVQGGIICAFIDEVCGPLTFMAAKRPVVTLDLNTTFIRPFKEKDEYVCVKAEVVSQSKSLIVIQAQVKTKEGKLIAVATSHSMILSDEQLSRKVT